MTTSSRFTEHFNVTSNLMDHKYNSSNNSNQTLSEIGSDQYEYAFDNIYRRLSTNTINSTTSNYSINEQCCLKRQSRVRTRRSSENSLTSSLSFSSISNSSIVGWCLRQRSKITTKLHRS